MFTIAQVLSHHDVSICTNHHPKKTKICPGLSQMSVGIRQTHNIGVDKIIAKVGYYSTNAVSNKSTKVNFCPTLLGLKTPKHTRKKLT
jgi:hypothetical protein